MCISMCYITLDLTLLKCSEHLQLCRPGDVEGLAIHAWFNPAPCLQMFGIYCPTLVWISARNCSTPSLQLVHEVWPQSQER